MLFRPSAPVDRPGALSQTIGVTTHALLSAARPSHMRSSEKGRARAVMRYVRVAPMGHCVIGIILISRPMKSCWITPRSLRSFSSRAGGGGGPRLFALGEGGTVLWRGGARV